MKTALIYTGELRTWNRCRENQEQNLIRPEHELFWHTYEDPQYRGRWVPISNDYCPPGETPYHANKIPETIPERVLNMWHNIFVHWALTPHRYDCYVRARPDIRFDGVVELNNEPGVVYIPVGNDFRGGVNDQFAFGGYAEMKCYFELYLNFKKMFSDGLIFHPEYYLKQHLERKGIRIERVPVHQSILRP